MFLRWIRVKTVKSENESTLQTSKNINILYPQRLTEVSDNYLKQRCSVYST